MQELMLRAMALQFKILNLCTRGVITPDQISNTCELISDHMHLMSICAIPDGERELEAMIRRLETHIQELY